MLTLMENYLANDFTQSLAEVENVKEKKRETYV